MQYSNAPCAAQVAGMELSHQRAILESFIERAVDLLDQLDAPFEDREDGGNYEAEETVDGYSA